MRILIAVPVVLLGMGCHSVCWPSRQCREVETVDGAELQRAARGPVLDQDSGPICEKEVASPKPKKCLVSKVEHAPPCVEVNAPEEIHVKAPPQKVVIETAAPAAPVAQAAPMAAPPMAPQYMQQMTVMSAPVESGGAVGALPAIGFDVIRVPIPILRLFAVPRTQQVTMQFAAPTTIAAPMAQAPVYAAPVAQAPVYAAPVAQAPVYAAPVAAAPVYAAPICAAPAAAVPQMAPVQQPCQSAPQMAPVQAPCQSSPQAAPTLNRGQGMDQAAPVSQAPMSREDALAELQDVKRRLVELQRQAEQESGARWDQRDSRR